MSTERKPGSRGTTNTFSGAPSKAGPKVGQEPGTRQTPKTKGSTKTASPGSSFKRKKKK